MNALLLAALAADIGDEAWQAGALCAQADPEAWFPEKGASVREPKRICMQCPVRADCLEYAVSRNERWGVWGGLSEHERRPLVNARYRQGRAA